MGSALAERLVFGIAAKDTAAIAACFASDAELRALTPPGLRERSGGDDAAALIAAWFADSTELALEDVQSAEVGDRLRISYRFVGVEDGARYVVEQQLVCVVRDGVITHADLLCSGFRPR